jgi:hypothetical protein
MSRPRDLGDVVARAIVDALVGPIRDDAALHAAIAAMLRDEFDSLAQQSISEIRPEDG